MRGFESGEESMWLVISGLPDCWGLLLWDGKTANVFHITTFH